MADKAVEIMLIPEAELATGQAAAIRNAARKAVVEKASVELKVAPEDLLVRDINPKTDLDYSRATWDEKTGTTADAYETMSTGTMTDKRYMGIYGVKDTSSCLSVTLLKITVGNSIKAIWNLENLYSSNSGEVRNGFCPSVVIIPQNVPYTISRYVIQTDSPAQIALRGFVVEKVGKVLTP